MSDLTELVKSRVSAAEKAAYTAAALQLEVTLSEYIRQAMEEKLERDLGITVGEPGRPPLNERVRDDDDDALADAPVFAFPD